MKCFLVAVHLFLCYVTAQVSVGGEGRSFQARRSPVDVESDKGLGDNVGYAWTY